MEPITLSCMLGAIANGGAKSMVRVAGYDDRAGIQQALDLGANGVLIPYINTAAELREAVSCCKYPLPSGAANGTRSVYFPQRCTNQAGLLGYAGAHNDNVIIAMQVETKACIDNMEEIAAVDGVDIMFLGQNDLCMSMGLFGKCEFASALLPRKGRELRQGSVARPGQPLRHTWALTPPCLPLLLQTSSR